MIDPFLVPPAERDPRGSPSFPRRPARIPRNPPFYNENADVLQARPKNLEGWKEKKPVHSCAIFARARVAKSARHLRQKDRAKTPPTSPCGLPPRHAGCDSCPPPHPFSHTLTGEGAQRCNGLEGRGGEICPITPTSTQALGTRPLGSWVGRAVRVALGLLDCRSL